MFALLGVALGASNRKDGKLASFVLGIGVIFVYYVIMFTAQALTKGFWIPPWLAMWLPNILLGAAGVCLLVAARAVGRSADSHSAAGVAARRLPSTTARRHRPRRRRRVAPAAPRSCSASRTSSCRGRPCSTSTSRKLYLRILGMTMVGMLGLFYISTFIDLSDKLFKGQTPLGMLLEFLFWSTPQFLSYIIAHRGAARRRW